MHAAMNRQITRSPISRRTQCCPRPEARECCQCVAGAWTGPTSVAARIGDNGLDDAVRSGVGTHSPKVFIPNSTLCRDKWFVPVSRGPTRGSPDRSPCWRVRTDSSPPRSPRAPDARLSCQEPVDGFANVRCNDLRGAARRSMPTTGTCLRERVERVEGRADGAASAVTDPGSAHGLAAQLPPRRHGQPVWAASLSGVADSTVAVKVRPAHCIARSSATRSLSSPTGHEIRQALKRGPSASWPSAVGKRTTLRAS